MQPFDLNPNPPPASNWLTVAQSMVPPTILALTVFALFAACDAADNNGERSVNPAKLSALIQRADKIMVLEQAR